MSRSKTKYGSLFPYDEPRESQLDGMERIQTAVAEQGIVTMEGACGTGKTLTALVPYLDYARTNGTGVNRVFIVTSVKQQMEAFQDEVRRINDSLPDGVRPVTALTLVSVPDLHPFVEQGVIEEDDYNTIDSLREGARTLVDEDAYDYTYDELYLHAAQFADDGDEYEYPAQIPQLDEVEYDPYYAKYRAKYDVEEDNVEEVLPFDTQFAGLLTVESLRSICGRQGMCPHSMMRLALEYVDVVIGNYNHVFDPKTVDRVTYPLINNNTVAIFDEAHNLVPRVREFLSKKSPLTSIARAQNEIREVALLGEMAELSDSEVQKITTAAMKDETDSIALGDSKTTAAELQDVFTANGALVSSVDDVLGGRKEVWSVLETIDVSPSQLRKLNSYLADLEEVIAKKVNQEKPLYDDDSIQLRDPETPEHDAISDWTKLHSEFESNPMEQAGLIGEGVSQARNTLTDDSTTPQTRAKSVGDLLTAWAEKDHIRYYRAIEIKKRYQTTSDASHQWQENHKAELTLHNCIPRDEISTVLNHFHSTVLMSATLEPLDVYHRTTGIDLLEDEGRAVYQCRYGLAFPEENRVTIGVPATKFKYGNRGTAFNNFGPIDDTPTREEYHDILFNVVRSTPGNVLIVMPNYKEAEWIGSLLEQSYHFTPDDIFIDESSSNEATSELKEEFFESDNAVLVTGARGTLIEGIDYIGDRLHAVVVCGVPITHTDSDYKRAIQAAYDTVFDDIDGFTLAFTIPAVWKTRQALGRVIRTENDKGSRILVDERYVNETSWDSVYDYLSPSERDELRIIPPEDIDLRLDAFWDMHNK